MPSEGKRGSVNTATRQAEAPSGVLTRDQLRRMLRWMLLSRELDEAELRLLRQQKVSFSISGAGHEAVQAAAALLLRPGRDWFFPYYRDRALCLGLGLTPLDMLLHAMGRAGDPCSGGRQMPSHWGHPGLNIVSQSSPTGTQFLPAVGAAEVGRIAAKLPAGDDRPAFESDEIVYVSGGEGSVSEGEFYEAICAAAMKSLPVLFLIEDNGYAISVPVEDQTPGGSISWTLRGVEGLRVLEADGLDPIKSYEVLSEAVRHVRVGAGPVLVHAHVTRLSPHSNSDNHADYRSAEELEENLGRDPIRLFETRLLTHGDMTHDELRELHKSVKETVQRAIDEAARDAEPDPMTLEKHLFASAGDSLETDVGPWEGLEYRGPRSAEAPQNGESLTLVEAIRSTLETEMARYPRILVFGQDVADWSQRSDRVENSGKGGVFKATRGLQARFGDHRVFNTALAEAAIVGRAIGMAVRGLRPVVEIQFFDYIWPAMMQIRNELGLMRWRSNGTFSAPVVIRVPIGGYLRGGSVYHSQSAEAVFCHCPGLRVVLPSNARDAVGLLRTAIRSGDPVLFLEHKHLYRQPYTRRPGPGESFRIPFGQAEVVRIGSDATLVTYGALVHRAQVAAERLAADGVELEVIDLRSLKPYDFSTLAESVKKTSRLIVATEETADFGVAAELAARASEELFLHLDAPVKRIGALDLPVAYNAGLEEATLPQTETLVDAVRETVRF